MLQYDKTIRKIISFDVRKEIIKEDSPNWP